MSSGARPNGGPVSGEAAPIAAATGEILSNRAVTQHLYQMRLALPSPWGPPEPGQFVALTLEPKWEEALSGDGGRALLRRPFSVAGFELAGTRPTAEVLYACVGKVTRQMCQLPPGATVDVLGPVGTAFPRLSDGHGVLVGGGRGIAPLLFVARQLKRRAQPFSLLYGTPSQAHALALDEFADSLQLATEDGSGGLRGTVMDLLKKYPVPPRPVVMACGPQAMLEAVSGWALRQGYPCWVSLEEIFGCSLGMCGGCAVPAGGDRGAYGGFLWACRDGPVVPAQHIDWEAWRSVNA